MKQYLSLPNAVFALVLYSLNYRQMYKLASYQWDMSPPQRKIFWPYWKKVRKMGVSYHPMRWAQAHGEPMRMGKVSISNDTIFFAK